MISLLAWPRAVAFTLLLCLLTPGSYARENSLFTSSVTYCKAPETILIQRFEVAYFPSNTSVSFNISASSVQPNVSVTANVLVNVYGMKPLNLTVDLCNILKGALCPLPMYNFTGADSITLPASLNVKKFVPGIAFVIPDLEGFAQLTLTDKKGQVRACVQTTLSNGWSAHQEAVEWTTGGLAIAAVIAAGAFSLLFPESIIPFRFLELVHLYQTIASTALLNLNYPSVYRAFALNFAWALGLIGSPDSSMQRSINNMRHLTAGKLADASQNSAVGLVNRKLSPFNAVVIARRSLEGAARHLSRRDTIKGEVQIVTAQSSNVLQAGAPIYVNLIGIATANAFMTVFLIALCTIAVALGIFALGFGVLVFMRRRRTSKANAGPPLHFDYRSFVISWLLRLGLAIFFPLLIFIFYQWTLKDSWLSILLSVISFVAVFASLSYPSIRILRLARAESPYSLYRGPQLLSRFGPLYAQYRIERYWFFIPVLVAFFLRSIFIAFARGSAIAQISLMVTIELGLVLSHFILKPFNMKRTHIFTSYLATTRFLATVLMIAFLEKLQVKAIPRVVIGIIIVLMWSVAVLFMVGNIVYNIVFAIRRDGKGAETLTASPASSKGSMLEKGLKGDYDGSATYPSKRNASSSGTGNSSQFYMDADSDSVAEVARARPFNPTPEQSLPIDSVVLSPFPISPTGTTISTMEPPSLYSSESGTMTPLGSILPRRWSNSQPGTPMSMSSQGHAAPTTPSTPSESTHSHGPSSNISRHTSLRRQIQQRYANIEEDSEGGPPQSGR